MANNNPENKIVQEAKSAMSKKEFHSKAFCLLLSLRSAVDVIGESLEYFPDYDCLAKEKHMGFEIIETTSFALKKLIDESEALLKEYHETT